MQNATQYNKIFENYLKKRFPNTKLLFFVLFV